MTEYIDQRFPIVPAEEIAFAMSIFVAAANMRIPFDTAVRQTAASGEGQRIYPEASLALGEFASSEPTPSLNHRRKRNESSLDYAFGVLWQHYAGDRRRAAICARVLAFYYLTTGNAGLLENWLHACPESPEAVILDPAIVEAVASVALTEDGRLSESLFMTRVRTLAQIAPAD